jgi:hypothetical protein
MTRTLLAGTLAAFAAALLVACAGSALTPEAMTVTPNLDQPANSADTPQTAIVPTTPQGGYVYGEAPVDSVEAVILESFPVQVHAIVRGNLPDGCTEIAQASAERSGDTFTVTLTTRRPADQDCTQALVPYEQTVPLDVINLPAGEYIVRAGGVMTTFTLNVDNRPPAEPTGGGGQVVRGLAPVQRIAVLQDGSSGGQPQIEIDGYLPDGCTHISTISDHLQGSTIKVVVETERPADLMCTQMIEPFQTTYTLAAIPGRGTYTIDANGAVAQITIP